MNPSNLLRRFSQTFAGFSFVWFFFLLLSYRALIEFRACIHCNNIRSNTYTEPNEE
jgi:hypothetical protein